MRILIVLLFLMIISGCIFRDGRSALWYFDRSFVISSNNFISLYNKAEEIEDKSIHSDEYMRSYLFSNISIYLNAYGEKYFSILEKMNVNKEEAFVFRHIFESEVAIGVIEDKDSYHSDDEKYNNLFQLKNENFGKYMHYEEYLKQYYYCMIRPESIESMLRLSQYARELYFKSIEFNRYQWILHTGEGEEDISDEKIYKSVKEYTFQYFKTDHNEIVYLRDEQELSDKYFLGLEKNKSILSMDPVRYINEYNIRSKIKETSPEILECEDVIVKDIDYTEPFKVFHVPLVEDLKFAVELLEIEL